MNEQNAKQEYNPWNRSPEDYGAPEWRLLNVGEKTQLGDEYNCKDYRCEPQWRTGQVVGDFPHAHTEWRRRITPVSTPADAPTDATGEAGEKLPLELQFLEGHCSNCEEPYKIGRLFFDEPKTRALFEKQARTIATLRAECAGLRADRARLDWLDEYQDRAVRTVDTIRAIRDAIDTARNKTKS